MLSLLWVVGIRANRWLRRMRLCGAHERSAARLVISPAGGRVGVGGFRWGGGFGSMGGTGSWAWADEV